ncbi:MAG TPA: hypothetical protein VM686_19000 [Polyangiaceae bacterium]|nr:hypothetical protein [Polyangiaceae bacterium]
MSYCAEQMTDGVVVRPLVAAFCMGCDMASVVAELIDAGVWQEHPTGYELRDWAQHNITADAWAQKKEDHRQRMAAIREAKRAREKANEVTGVHACDRSQADHSDACDASVQQPPLDEGRRTKDEDEDLSSRDRSPEGGPAAVAAPESGPVAEVFEYWRTVMGKRSTAVLSDKRRRLIRAAIKSHGVDTAKAAIDGCARTPWNMGENPDRRRFDDIELILRDAQHIERFADAPQSLSRRGFSPPAAEHEFTQTELTPDLFRKKAGNG